MNDFDQHMKRCLLLAEKGLGTVAPNPMVGCVIVHKGNIIGEGYHRQYGGPHAEVHAINAVADKSLLAESILFVNLEPCSHLGKTPPCSDLIIQHKIKRVVIGCQDANPMVSGRGIEKLKQAGVEVVTDVLKDECRELNKRFFTYHEKKRPYIILKWAQTLDGFISKKAPFTGEENQVSSAESKKLLHAWRGQEQAIMVGTNTALIDNPQLTVRLAEGKNPLRVVIDRELKIDAANAVFSAHAETLVFTEKKCADKDHIKFARVDFSKNILPQVLDVLYQHKILSIIVEGGTRTLQHFIDDDLWDEARVFTSGKMFIDGLKGPHINGHETSSFPIGNDTLRILKNVSGT